MGHQITLHEMIKECEEEDIRQREEEDSRGEGPRDLTEVPKS